MKTYVLMILLIIGISLSSEVSEKFMNPSIYTPSIFDLNNITMNHTMSFMAGASSNKQGFYQSMYTNHINYRISSKLNFKMNLNFVNYGTAAFDKKLQFEGNGDNDSVILPEFSLTYKPTESFSVIIEYGQYNTGRHWYYSDNWYRK